MWAGRVKLHARLLFDFQVATGSTMPCLLSRPCRVIAGQTLHPGRASLVCLYLKNRHKVAPGWFPRTAAPELDPHQWQSDFRSRPANHKRAWHRRTGAFKLLPAAAFPQPLQGPVSSARSCVPLRMRSITTGVSHLYRANPHRATKRRCFCAMLAAATTDARRAALVRVPCPRWPTRIRRLGVPCASEKRANR
jgi:hypothetical protein